MTIPDAETHQQHRRYLEQAVWTTASRQRLLELAGLNPGSFLLEVGAGTGAICSNIAASHDYHTFGLDIDPAATRFACRFDPITRYLVGDGCHLPFPSSVFDAVFCHFLLLWLDDPLDVLEEMLRLTRPSGCLMAFAEPDYGGRLDYPRQFGELGELQIEALERQGADPYIGRRLRALFVEAGAREVFSGVLGAEWTSSELQSSLEAEREILSQDLESLPPSKAVGGLLDAGQAWSAEQRTLFVPTFFALGFAP
jgi:SAM-dependent methyltransferase